MLPKDFSDYTATLFGDTRWQRYLASFDEPTPISIRVNPFKVAYHRADDAMGGNACKPPTSQPSLRCSGEMSLGAGTHGG